MKRRGAVRAGVAVLIFGVATTVVVLVAGLNDSNRRTEALAVAVQAGDAPQVRELLRDGANANGDYTLDRSLPAVLLLGYACEAGQRDIAKSLVARGANVNPSARWLTPLSAAITARDTDLVQFLLAHGADPQAQSVLYSKDGRSMATPIESARNEARANPHAAPKIIRILTAAIRDASGTAHPQFQHITKSSARRPQDQGPSTRR